MAAERMAVERMALSSLATDPLIRLQMAGINPEVRPQVECKIQDSLCIPSNHYACLRFLRTLTLISTCTLMPPR